MSWCDKLASVPSVGFGLDWHFAPSNEILGALSPILDPLVKSDKPRFTIGRHDAFNATVNTDDGFNYGVEPSRVFVAFQHMMRPKSVSGGAPIMEMLSYARPYTELLGEICDRLKQATLVVPGRKNRRITRVGIVSTTVVDESDLPPGISRFIEHIGRPWGGKLDSYAVNIMSILSENSVGVDRCNHVLSRPKDEEELLTVQFDWQRTFTASQIINEDSIDKIFKTAERDALAYFEELAVGSQFDAQPDSAEV